MSRQQPMAGGRCSYPLRRQQRGVALAISLVLMVAMTILGVATLSGTRLNEQITSNVQQKAIVFEAAETAINSAWSLDRMLKSATAQTAADFNDPQPTEQTDLMPVLSDTLDQSNDKGKSVDISAEVSIQFCGEDVLPEGSSLSADESQLQFVGHLFDVNGVADMASSNATADHMQRGMRVGPKTGRTGACIVRGS